MRYVDFLYGEIEIKGRELKLIQCPEFLRSKFTSLASYSWQNPCGQTDSRFQHSLGVARLVKEICKKEEFKEYEDLLFVSSMMHDLGHPPFHHIMEHFMNEDLGKDHEEMMENIVRDSNIEKIVEKDFGISINEPIEIILKKHKLSPLMNGTIDLDNLDNTLRVGMQQGTCAKLYDPLRLVHCFGFDGKKITLDGSYWRDLLSWQQCRDSVYGFIHENELVSSSTMMTKAVEIARDLNEIPKEFYTMKDYDAFEFLLKCNPETKELVSKVVNWDFYPKQAEKLMKNPEEETKRRYFSDFFMAPSKLSKELCNDFGIEKKNLTVFAAEDKGHKNIDLPFINEEQANLELFNISQPFWMIKVFTSETDENKLSGIKKRVEEIN